MSQEVLNQHHTDNVKLSFVLFDEIEKASDALWNLLLGILGKATLTLGDNRKVDFSAAMVFLTSNLGAAEMSSLVSPRLGFHALSGDAGCNSMKLSSRISNAGIAAARRKFTPEFINRLDNIVVRIQGSRTPEELLLEREHQTLVEQELSRVPPLYCDALRLASCEDQSMKEIAGHLGISVPTAKTRARRGRAHLRREVLARLSLKDGLTPESRARLEPYHRGIDWTAAA